MMLHVKVNRTSSLKEINSLATSFDKKNHTHLNMHVHLKTAYQVLVYLLRGTKNIHAIFF